MSNLKQRISYKVMALFLAVLMVVSMIPTTVIAYPLDSAESPCKAKNLKADYNAETDSVDMTWDAFETAPYELWVCVGGAKTEKVEAPNTTGCSVKATSGGEQAFSLLAYANEEDTEGVKSEEITVEIANTFASVSAFNSVEADNDLTIAEIINLLTTEAKVTIDENDTESVGHTVIWNTDSVNYDRTVSGEQTITIPGVVVLDKNKVQNRNKLSLDCSIDVKVKAAVDVSITSDLDDSAPVEKKVGERLALSVEATGTAPKYQWYKKTAEATAGTAIDGATSATFTINAVALTDTAQYYCVVTGKNKTTATSKAATVSVSKNATSVDLSIDPEKGQTRPESITLKAIGIPDDAAGKVIFEEGNNLIKEITLPNADKTATFKASGTKNSYNFTVIYDAGEDNAKYLGSEKTISDYSFEKANQTVAFKPTALPTEITYSKNAGFTVEATGSKTSLEIKYEYAIVEEKDADGKDVSNTVASINKDTGEVKISAVGSFKVTVKALSDDDYNESPVVTSDEIKVNRAEQEAFKFETVNETKITYFHNFNYTRKLVSIGTGDGAITYELGKATTALGVNVDSDTGEITYNDADKDNDVNFAGSVGVVEVVATKAASGNYKETSASYVIEILKATPEFAFEMPKPEPIIYTKNAKAFKNEAKGYVCKRDGEDIKPEYSISSEKSLENDTAEEVVSIDHEGNVTAKRSGKVVIIARLPGNGVYEKAEASYELTINRGTVDITENGSAGLGFHFNLGNSTIKYGEGFTNAATGGQSDSNSKVVYSVSCEDEVYEVYKDEVYVENDGSISFRNEPAKATNKTYIVTVTATKQQDDKYEKCSISYQLTVERDTVNPETDFLVNGNAIKDATKLTSPDGWYNAAHTEITITPSGGYTLISEDGSNWETSIKRTADGKHAIAFYLKAEDGSISQFSTQTVNYDKTAATAKLSVDKENVWEQFLETITFGIYRSSKQDVVVKATDELSKVSKVEYYIHDNGVVEKEYIENTIKTADIQWKELSVSEDEEDENTLQGIVEIEAEDLTFKKAILYVKVTDNAGNVTYLRSNGIVFDIIPPNSDIVINESGKSMDIEIELGTDAKVTEGIYNTTVPFKVTVEDKPNEYGVTSGVRAFTTTIEGTDGKGIAHKKEIFITVKDDSKELKVFDSGETSADKFNFEVKIDNETVKTDYTDAFTVPLEFDSNRISIYVEASDWAGNPASTINKKYLAIDETPPVINVTYNDTEDTFSNERYIGNNKNRVATIDITELNFDNSAVVITVTRDGKAVDIKPNFTAINGAVDKNGDQIGWRMVIDYAALGEGDFTFDISCTDKAGNTNKGWNGDNVAVNKSFTIDNTKPIITVEITNDNVKNDKYFAADRKAIVTIIERNFSEDYKFDWSGLTFALDGEILTAPTPVITKNDNGTYERVYTIDFSNEGDYTFDVKYTDLADNLSDTYVCSSVAYKEFTVDKTAPVLDIRGVADKSANNGDIAPIVTYSDVNFDKDAVSIVLTGINNGTVNYKGAYTENTHGQTYTYANFEKVKKVDDIYTLTVKLTDKAGNETEKAITFSANRFGSVYDLTEVKDIISKYLQVEEDIVFTETNVDSLEREGIKIKLTKNGTPTDLVEGTDYTVEVTGGKGQWSVYKYTVKKALFADDGRYSLSIYSKDAAGNVNENIDETKEAEISFGIDKTNPVIVPIDFESGVQYAVDMKTVSVEIKDNLVLEGVKIYLNGEETEYKVDGETYTFDIPKSNSKQDVKIVALDAAGNEQLIEVNDFLVNTNIFVRWYNNTPLFVGSIIGVVVLALGITIFLVFFKKKKEDK